MAATEMWSQRRGPIQELTPDGKIVWSAERTYQVTDCFTEADAIAQTPFSLGDDHPVYGSELKVNVLDPNQRGPTGIPGTGAGFWEVRVAWSSRVPSAGGNVNQDATISWGDDVVVEQVDRDFDGHPLVNSVGDPPPTPLTNDFYDVVFTYTQWEPGYNIRKAIKFRNSVNADDFTINFGTGPFNGSGSGFGGEEALRIFSGEMKCTSCRPVGEYRATQSLVQVYYEFKVRERIPIEEELFASGWDWRFLDQGTRGLYFAAGSTTELTLNEFHIDSNVPATEPVRLNGLGAPIKSGITVAGHEPAEALSGLPPTGAVLDSRYADSDPGAVFLIYKKMKRNNFAGLLPIFQ